MTLAPELVPADARQDFLGSCLLEGDPELERRARRVKRRAIAISIVFEILFVAALVLLPLLGKTENISALMVRYPRVPYSAARTLHPPDHHRIPPREPTGFFEPTRIPTVIVDRDATPPTPPPLSGNVGDSEISRYTEGDGAGPGVPFAGSNPTPAPPAEPPVPPQAHLVRVSGLVQQGKLINRVQPVYPPLAIQVRREGRVELHAIIAMDGSVESLEVVSGDPFFLQSALAAVRQWRYRPTTLNGRPVEVDTHITVIYTLAQ
ncbi:MAG TPA: energy transducer TonB [Candidatus Acidoferrum sp.]|nr:energy transducer TonB [Candidatus Acidoferrum sp.]